MVDIEPARSSDTDAIERVLRAAFEDGIEAELDAVLREGGDLREGCSMVARDGEDVVGYVAISDAELVGVPDAAIAVLGPVGVRPDRQREGIGTALIRESLRACTRTGCDAVVLEGDPDFYSQFGFEAADEYGIASDLNPPPGTFQAWECWPDALDDIGGEVRHPAPFHAL